MLKKKTTAGDKSRAIINLLRATRVRTFTMISDQLKGMREKTTTRKCGAQGFALRATRIDTPLPRSESLGEGLPSKMSLGRTNRIRIVVEPSLLLDVESRGPLHNVTIVGGWTRRNFDVFVVLATDLARFGLLLISPFLEAILVGIPNVSFAIAGHLIKHS